MNPVIARVDFAELDKLTRKELIARLLGMRRGATTTMSVRHLEQMSKDRLRVLFLLSHLFRVLRARQTLDQS